MSSIDSWGLAYNANGITRGIDLTKVMRYKIQAAKASGPAEARPLYVLAGRVRPVYACLQKANRS